MRKAVAWTCFAKKISLKILQNSQKNTCARAYFLVKLQAYNFLKKETLKQNLFRNTFFTEYLRGMLLNWHIYGKSPINCGKQPISENITDQKILANSPYFKVHLRSVVRINVPNFFRGFRWRWQRSDSLYNS